MKIESGPAKADAIWQLIRAVLFLGFALWFIYDGAVRYPEKNRIEAELQLKDPNLFNGQLAYDDLPETPTKDVFEQLERTNPTNHQQVLDVLGEPQITRTQGRTRRQDYFVSRFGYAYVEIESNRVKGMTWHKWYKTKAEIEGQFYWAIIPAIPGLYFLWRLYKARTLRVTIDDDGMIYDGRRIAFAEMVSLRDYSPKGWIDLYHRVNGQEKRLRLDNEKVLKFNEIVDAICHAKGFKNEVQAYAEQKARDEAGEDNPPPDQKE